MTPRDLIEEYAFRELEMEGAFYPDRSDYIRSLGVYLLLQILLKGRSVPADLEKELLQGGLRLKKTKKFSYEEDGEKDMNRKNEMLFSILQSVYSKKEKGK
ncbi:MAG: hypothetical protein Q4G69_00815 [Planctomycetia bacterium]|nr:hypothetical protein [Planctomycetia bacterium]